MAECDFLNVATFDRVPKMAIYKVIDYSDSDCVVEDNLINIYAWQENS